ncbi:MAG: hypothetical protein P8Y72_09265 [Anaerolineales bacterium]|jgi:hypothetical protein
MLIPVTHILPVTTIERRRMLPIAGTVLVRAGQEVRADEVIATADLKGEHISLDLARGLGVPKSKTTSYLQREIGDEIPEGAVIASRPGLVSRVVRAPKAGKLVAVGGGQALLQITRRPFELKAGIPGAVVKVEADYGAIIQVTGAWVQGVWGNGRIGIGGLYVSADSPDHVLQSRDLDPSQRGQVMLAGHCNNPKMLDALDKIKMRGLILGSMDTRLRPIASRMPYPIMVLEGFGKIPINPVAYRLLSTSAQRETTLNAARFDRATGERPELIIPVVGEVASSVPVELEPLDVGKRVRIMHPPYRGMVGTVSNLAGNQQMPNGLRAESVEITFGEEEKVVVPVANIEILG